MNYIEKLEEKINEFKTDKTEAVDNVAKTIIDAKINSLRWAIKQSENVVLDGVVKCDFDGCTCGTCGSKYKMDLIVSDELWEKITPSKTKDSGLLCPSCIVKSVEEIKGYSIFKMNAG